MVQTAEGRPQKHEKHSVPTASLVYQPSTAAISYQVIDLPAHHFLPPENRWHCFIGIVYMPVLKWAVYVMALTCVICHVVHCASCPEGRGRVKLGLG